jgi:quinoprotein glucose dehydrogenase
MKTRTASFAMGLLTLGVACAATAQRGAPNGEWPAFSADAGSTRYSPLDQINKKNVKTLSLAWRWDGVDDAILKQAQGMRVGYFKNTPLMIGGVLYVTTPMNQVCAVDPGTGETLWVFDTKAYEGAGRKGPTQHRGLAYWSSGPDKRLFIATANRRLYSINADTGQADSKFGDQGWVDLGKGFDMPVNENQIRYSAPPAIVGNTIVLGCLLPDEASNPDIPPGHIRGFDARTGAQKWIFYTIPREGQPGNETWEEGSWKTAGAANTWSMISADLELGYLYCPTGTPANDFYGGHRPGDNLFAESILCLNAATGERVWSFQGVHHGLWDYDFPAAPILLDIAVDGKKIKALVQVSKQGFTYVLDRVTGKPVWPIEERPVPQTDVPGEKTSKTQPFPTKPPAFERQGITEDDLIDFTPALRQAALEFVKKYRMGPLFSPPALTTEANGAGATIQIPGAAGGANWGSAGVDPETGRLFVQSATQPSLAGLVVPDPNLSAFRYKRGGSWLLTGPNGLPLTKPPYGRITAIDLNKGEILWQVAHGDGPRNHPLLKDLNLPPLGWGSNTYLSGSGPVVTKTLVFFSHAAVDNATGGYLKDEARLRAFDKDTGAVLWEEKLPLQPYAVPMTYMHQGRQYIVVAAGGQDAPAALLAYALPK